MQAEKEAFLNQYLFFTTYESNDLILKKGLRKIRSLFFIFFFLYSSSILAQTTNNSIQIESPVIFMGDGAELYSADETFNKQVLNQKITIKDHHNVNIEIKRDQQVLIVGSKRQLQPKTDVSAVANSSGEKKGKDIARKIKIDLDDLKNKQLIAQNQLNSVPSSEQFLKSNHHYNSLATTTSTVHDLLKLLSWSINYSNVEALKDLHSPNNSFYNSTSLGYCYSFSFSVRPPPFFIFLI